MWWGGGVAACFEVLLQHTLASIDEEYTWHLEIIPPFGTQTNTFWNK